MWSDRPRHPATRPAGSLRRMSRTSDPTPIETDAAVPLTPAGRRLVLFAMTGSLTMIMMDTTVVGVALPTIGRELGLGDIGLAWVVNAYLLALASLIAIGGRVGDLIGKPRAFRIGVTTFAAASVLCGVSTTGGMLIAARVLQALGAVLMQPASSAIVVSTAEPGREGRAMGVYIGISMLGLVAGPVIGGVLTAHVGWSWIFFVNIPVAVFALAMVQVARPPALRDPDGGFDLPSVAMLVVALPLGVGAVQQLGAWGPTDVRTIGGLAVGLLGLAVFVHRQTRLARPLVHLELFRDRGFLADAAMLGLVQFALTGTVIHLSILTQAAWRFDPQQAGLATLPLVLPVLVLVHVSGRLYDRVGVRRLAVPAAIVVALGVIGLGVGAMERSLVVLFAAMTTLGVAIPFVNMPANTDGMRRIGMERRGLASGLLQTVRMTGSTLGIAVTASVAGGGWSRDGWTGGVAEGEPCAGIDPGVYEQASGGDLAALSLIVDRLGTDSACVALLRDHLAGAIGLGFIVSGVVSGLAVFAALAWRPAEPAQSSPSPSSGNADDI